ncbi:MAG: hypothetical protein H7X75_09580 [Burkholderiaceae bacterium]|nr:hypothetical protein [Burkholderiaceae bacterium]
MHFTLLVAGALVPAKLATALCASLDTPHLLDRLAHAKSIETTTAPPSAGADFGTPGTAHLDWLARRLFSRPSHSPTGPYALAEISGAIPTTFVWHADPVHVEVARDRLVVQAIDTAPTADDAAQLIGIANELLSAAGCQLVAAGDQWFLLTEHDWAIDALPLASVLGSSVTMPVGPDAQTWTRLHNEIQMAWHAQSMNQMQDRETQTINALWLHGGGRWQPLPHIEFAQVQCDAPEWRGAARAADARGCPLESTVIDRTLIVIDDLLAPKQREDWAAWLQILSAIDRRLGAHQRDAVDLVLTGSTQRAFASRHSDRYRFWRRRTLAEALTE